MSVEKAKEYLVRRISPGETYNDLLEFPRFFEVETIHACNARCPMCTIGNWQRPKGTMTEALFDKVASELIDNAGSIKRVSLYRDGEPLLDARLPDRIATLKAGNITNVAISTNVSLLDESKAAAILEAGIDTVILSIDSLRKDVYESIRVGLDFEEVRDNAIRFILLRNRIRPQARIWMRMVRQEENQDEWPAYRAFWAKYVAPDDRVYYRIVHNWGGQLKGFRPLSKSYQPALPCVALWSCMPIYANGDVPICSADYNMRYYLGNVADRSIRDLWHCEVLERARREHLRGMKAGVSICEYCNIWDEPVDMPNISATYASAKSIPKTAPGPLTSNGSNTDSQA